MSELEGLINVQRTGLDMNIDVDTVRMTRTDIKGLMLEVGMEVKPLMVLPADLKVMGINIKELVK